MELREKGEPLKAGEKEVGGASIAIEKDVSGA